MEAADVHTYCNLAVSPPQHRAGRLGWAVLVVLLFAGVELWVFRFRVSASLDFRVSAPASQQT